MAKITDEAKRKFLTVYIPDTRGVTIARWGRGNLKIGLDGVYTYSRLPGHPDSPALGGMTTGGNGFGTCPGATRECQSICYAARPVAERGVVAAMWKRNSEMETLPLHLPDDAKIVRIHVSGDFTTPAYIMEWIELVRRYPHVRFFGYTRSWRIPTLLVALNILRAEPNVQLFASMDISTEELPPLGWRVAWIDGDSRAEVRETRRDGYEKSNRNRLTVLGARSFVCPEQTGHTPNCESCRYCIDGKRGDVTFLKH